MKYDLFMLLMFLTGSACCNEIVGKDYIDVELDKATYEFVLPPPFGRSSVLATLSNGEISELAVTTEVLDISIECAMLAEIHITGIPEVSVPLRDKWLAVGIESFSLFFESGNKYEITISDVPGCPGPCTDWVKDIVILTISKEGNVQLEILNVGEIRGSP